MGAEFSPFFTKNDLETIRFAKVGKRSRLSNQDFTIVIENRLSNGYTGLKNMEGSAYMYTIGIDLGTSAVKLLLVSLSGEIVRTATREYPLTGPLLQ